MPTSDDSPTDHTPDAPATPATPASYEHLADLADKGELTQEKLQEQLNAYSKAIEEEFAAATKAAPENTQEYTRDFFKKNVHSAAAQIVWLSINAYNESTKFAASKYVVEKALEDSKNDGDPIKQLLEDLTKKSKEDPTPVPDT